MDEPKHITQILKSVDVFKGLRTEDFEELAKVAKVTKVQAGQILFNEGDTADSIFVIMHGQMAVTKSGREIVRLQAGDMIGEMAILDHGSRSATLKAIGDTELIEISEKAFQEILGHKEITLRNILDILTHRIRESDKKLAIDHTIMTTLIHDINNLLTTFSAATVIQMKSKDASINSLAQIILDSQMGLSQMVQGALKMYRENQISTVKNDRDIINTIEKTINQYLTSHPDVKKMKIEYKKPLKNKDVIHNANDMIRVLSNIIINAAQASKQGQTITLEVNFDTKNCFITITDRGEGIPEHLLLKIFTPGFTSKSKGNGLGLFSCKNIVENLHEGQIMATSKIGEGSTFSITLPLS